QRRLDARQEERLEVVEVVGVRGALLARRGVAPAAETGAISAVFGALDGDAVAALHLAGVEGRVHVDHPREAGRKGGQHLGVVSEDDLLHDGSRPYTLGP